MTETNYYSRAPRSAEIAARFADLHPPLEKMAAVAEAHRCLYCFDAPCMNACPTRIDVASFIKKIASDNLEGSAKTVLEANILGASCARACPVEVLCEGACVLHSYNHRPIAIGLLQRYAMDAFHASGAPLPFMPGVDTGRKVALIGGGPASLACAAELRRRGIAAEIFDARPLPGGLNTYGVAEYKLPLAESLREIDLLAQLGVAFHQDVIVDASLLAELEREYDAVFLGVGLGAIQTLGLSGESSPDDVADALDFIAAYKSGELTTVPPRIAVIGGGNTAMDAASAAIRLGAEKVCVIYRRGAEEMSAFSFEIDNARQAGVNFLFHSIPGALGNNRAPGALEIVKVQAAADGSFVAVEGASFVLPVDLIVLAIGQAAHTDFLKNASDANAIVRLERGRIVIDRTTGQTSNPKYFAGGDCTNGGREVVDAVADGKCAGIGIAAWLDVQMQGSDHAHA